MKHTGPTPALSFTRARRLRAAGLISLCVIACVSAFTAAPALALPAQFGTEGEGAGQLASPRGIAVEQESRDVYIADRNNNRIDKFGPEGEFLLAWGWGVADGETNALQTCTTTCFRGIAGSGSGQFGDTQGLAVDNDPPSAGDLYVVDPQNLRVQKFGPEGEFLLMFGGEVDKTTGANVCTAASGDECGVGVSGSAPGQFVALEGTSIAVDSAGAIYVGDEDRVQKFSPAGAVAGQITLLGAGFPNGVAVDSAGDLYITSFNLTGVHKYDSAGTELGKPRDLTAVSSPSIALGPADQLFTSGQELRINEYGPLGSQLASFAAGVNGTGGAAYGTNLEVLYVVEGSHVLLVKPPPSGPFVVPASESASKIEPTTATLGAIINPEGPEATEYHFEYGTTTAYGQSTADTLLEGGPFEDQPASAAIKELQPRTLYHFRVVAENAAKEVTDGADQTFTTLPPVSIDSTSASQVNATSARLEAELNPHGLPSEYRFEYDTTPYLEGEAEHGIKVPIPDGNIGSGSVDATVSNLIQELLPSTTYHYRVVARNELGEVVGPDRSLRTQGEASLLPDGRSWEQVSPENKHGAPLEPLTEEGGLIQAATGGGGFAYIALGPITGEPKGVRSPDDSQLLAKRSSSGWSTQEISTPNEEVRPILVSRPSEYQFFAEDLQASLVQPAGSTPLSSQTTERTPYRREADGAFVPLVTASNVLPGVKFGVDPGVEVRTATNDLSHIVLESPQLLTPGFQPGFEPQGGPNLYELLGGNLRLISVLPSGEPAAEAGLNAGVGDNGLNMRGAISSDGERVVFETGFGGEHLYTRDVGLAQTLQLDERQPKAAGGGGKAVFQAASSDGTRVFFTDASRLTTDATSHPGKADLYMCEVEVSAGHLACALSDLSVDHNAGEAADVPDKVSAIDSAGAHVYFAANGVLTNTPNARGEHAVPGDCASEGEATCNMYQYDTGARKIGLVAVLSSKDAPDWAGHGNLAVLGNLTARSSPNGRYFTFMSQDSLTGYDNRDARSPGQRDEEVFLFDSTNGRVSCVSCDPTGARPDGVFEKPQFPGLLVDHPRTWWGGPPTGRWLAASIPGWTLGPYKEIALYQSRYLSDSGRMFFNAADALVPQDTNNVEDVYQFEPPGVGDCSASSKTYSSTSGGCVSLISSGSGKEESAFLDASETGDEVFFLTQSRLTASDVDSAFDVYDAHVCSSSSPCPPPPPAPPPACEGDACQTPSQPPSDATPGSLTYHGPGNATPPAPPAKPRAKPTRAQLLAKALKACKKKKSKKKRVACERQARKRYGAKKASVKRTKRAAPLHAPSTAVNPPPLPPTLPGAALTQKAPLASPSNSFLVPSAATASSAQAAEPSPWWRVTSRVIPSHLPPGGEGTIVVQAANLGNAPTVGKLDVSDVLPEGVTLQSAEYFASSFVSGLQDMGPSGPFAELEMCESSATRISCSSESKAGAFELVEPLIPFGYLELRLKVKAEPGAASGELNEVQASGGGARSVTAKRAVVITSEAAGFGVEDFSLVPEEEGGDADTHAGSHPYQLTNTLSFNRDSTNPLTPPALPRNLHFKLPPGQIGNATALPQCSASDFAHVKTGGQANSCPGNTAIGVTVVTATIDVAEEETVFTVPVFNLTPAQGEPARFGFEILRNPVILDTAVRSGPGEDYGVTVNVNNITQLVNFISATTTFWGAPADPSHNEARGWGCLRGGFYAEESGQKCELSHDAHPAAFLTLPTNCNAPYVPAATGESWPKRPTPEAAPETHTFLAVPNHLQDEAGNLLSITGCNQLAFAPSFEAKPTSQSASSPSGLDVNLNFDDEGLTSATGMAQSQIKDTTVTLPEGLTINPSSGVGLGGCAPADYERETLESEPGVGCPNNSKLGTVEIESPLISTAIHGSLFVAQPHENPFDSLVALYIVAKNPETGVIIKLAGRVEAGGQAGVVGLAPGQLRTTFEDNPQLPFSHFNFHFREGQQAPLITPATCGTYSTDALLTPWSEPLQGLTDTSPFSISSGVGGGACPAGTPPFTPQIAAGTQSNTAGAFSPFTLHLTRTDGESEISSFSTNLPPGLAGILAGIPFCPEEAIAAARAKTGAQEEQSPSCPSSSLLGHSEVGTGVGAVLAYTPGRVYLGGPYNGDPFSLVSVTSAVVGPFDLGTVVVRFGLRIDPRTAQVSVDPTASEPIPTIIDGIVTHVRDIRVAIDRPNFTLNPTSCSPMSISSTLQSNLGQSATISSPFQAASCASLKFTPKVAVATAGKASKPNGASLHFKIAYPPVHGSGKGALGTQSWFNEAKFTLPKQLPARLTTIQKACDSKIFEGNRAACPAGSKIGTAIVHTPVLPVPLQGPVYFVSYGGAQFPEAVLVLDGYGVHIELHGETFISSKGVTSATFRNTPDVPFESIEVTLPTGPFSEFGANLPHQSYNFCGQKLVMPTLFKAQNGLQINQNTPVTVTGCAKAKTRAQKLRTALKACKKKAKGKRAACQRQARRKYGPVKKK